MAGQSFELVGSDGTRIPLTPPVAGGSATHETILVPGHLQHAPFSLVASNDTARPGAIAVTVAGYSPLTADLDALALAALLVALLHFIATEIGAVILRFGGATQVPNLTLVGLGLLGFAAFWLYYIQRDLGIAFSALVLLALVLHAAWRTFKRGGDVGRESLQDMHDVWAPVATLTLLLLIVALYPFPDHWMDWHYVANRWLSLPVDTWLPKILADQVWAGHVSHPMLGSWLSSDRPPLQAGIFLLFRPLAGVHDGAVYEIVSTWLQASILVPLALMLPRLRMGSARGLALLVISTSALVLVNGAFVWPKLLAATYCLVCFTALYPSDRGHPLVRGIIAGVASALAMLSHGGAVFALVPIFVVWFVRDPTRQWRTLAIAALAAIALYAPWFAYQKLIDPPGSRLIAWHLAGVEAPSPLPIATILRDAYAKLTFHEWRDARVANLHTIIQGSIACIIDSFHVLFDPSPKLRRHIIDQSFYCFGYAQWFFAPLIAMIVAAAGWRKTRGLVLEQAALLSTICLGLVLWSVLMFKPGSTIIHQGAYFLNLAAMVLCMAYVHACSPRLFAALGLANLWVAISVYVLADRALPISNSGFPIYLDNASWRPAGSTLYFCLVALAILIHYRACRSHSLKPFRTEGPEPNAAPTAAATKERPA